MNSSALPRQTGDGLRGRLQYVDAEGNLRTLLLERPIFSVGRKSVNDLHLADGRVSRFHAEVIREGDHYVVRDKESRCGTFVNGERVTQKFLENGDRLRFGDLHSTDFVFYDGTTDSLPTQPLRTRILPHQAAGPDEFRRLALVLEAIQAVHSPRPLDEILRLIVDATIELTGTERGFIMLKGAHGELEHRIARGRDRADLVDDLSISRRLAQKVFTEGHPVVISDTTSEISLSTRESVTALRLRAIACYPLKLSDHREGEARSSDLRGETIGVLYVDGREGALRCGPEDQEALLSLVNQAAMVIENARLHRELQEKKAFEKELQLAHQIQQQLLPKELPDRDYLDVASINLPCRNVGGDYYDYMLFEDGRTGLVVGDVAGKGIPAALLMSTLQGIFYAQAFSCPEVAQTVEQVNRYLVKRSMENSYLTAFYGIISPDGALSYTNAGHTPPFLVRRDGRVEPLTAGGLALGLFDFSQYECASTKLEDGDVLLLFSDGVSEASDEEGEFFGEERLTDLVAGLRDRPAQEILDRALEEIRSYSNRVPQQDDLTLMVVKFARHRTTRRLRHDRSTQNA